VRLADDGGGVQGRGATPQGKREVFGSNLAQADLAFDAGNLGDGSSNAAGRVLVVLEFLFFFGKGKLQGGSVADVAELAGGERGAGGIGGNLDLSGADVTHD